MTFVIKIKNRKAKRILEDLASLDLIEIQKSIPSSGTKKQRTTDKTMTHMASESLLAKTWDSVQEDKAWQNS